MNDPLPFPIEAFYDSTHKCYLVKDDDSNWMSVSEKSMMLRIEKLGFSRKTEKNESLSVAEKVLLRVQNERNIAYAGPLAGYDCGLVYQGGYKVLVTHSPHYITPEPVSWDTIRAIIDGMLKLPDVDQTPYFHLWLKISEEAFRSKNFCKSPVMAIAGPAGCCKTLLSLLVTESLGGRSASPYRYMMGNTQFNQETVGAEVLIVDDEAASKDLRTRRRFGTEIKTMLFGGFTSGHGKGKNALTLKPFWRMMILLNDEPENLMVLPPIDESLEDKIIILKAAKFKMPMDTSTPDKQKALWRQLMKELPGYIWWLRNEFVTPPDLVMDQRTCMVAYKHPELTKEILKLSPEIRFISLIDNVLFKDREKWTGTAEELLRELVESSFGFEAKNLLSWPNATGTYLGRLAKLPEYAHRIKPKKLDGNTVRGWEILKATPENPS